MKATISGRLCAVIERTYTKDGQAKAWRELHLATSMSEPPEQIRVDDRDEESVAAFRFLQSCAWLDQVHVGVETQRFGQSMSMTLKAAEAA